MDAHGPQFPESRQAPAPLHGFLRRHRQGTFFIYIFVLSFVVLRVIEHSDDITPVCMVTYIMLYHEQSILSSGVERRDGGAGVQSVQAGAARIFPGPQPRW